MRKLPHNFLLFTCMFVIPLFFCKKQVDFAKAVAHDHLPPLSLTVSSSSVALFQANAKLNTVRFDWGYNGSIVNDAVYYTIQFSLKEDQFENPLEVPLGSSLAAGFSVEEFNQLMHKLIEPGDAGDVAARIKYMRQVAYTQKVVSGDEVYYSDQVLLKVTTYRHIIAYSSPDFFTLPGNYQSWDPLLAPRIVSKPGEREYEGYVYFPIEYPQFLLVRGNQWSDFIFGYIGGNKFGVKGSSLSIFGGKGSYLIQASTNTNTWVYTKINSWSITGSAVQHNGKLDLTMTQDPSNNCIWHASVNLIEGDLFFRANNNNAIRFGNDWPAIDHVPDYNADPIRITRAGKYTIELDLSIAGNYLYHIHRNR
ncbi:SusE domain-containing protein [Sediminibacterium sp.]|uniref:SusE domain-containing protein n=1 Tax=Sediminibacterium sp. TaxID=1917865 RepID=UPI0025FB6AD0|nr:SusE domain-containing protein [Sediminibacterium sp.]MBW0178935.1 SusE domain-containing protein [Sediminibacterium sp.]